MSNFIIINLVGGLGNQLFMLFNGISYAIDNNKQFLIHLEKNKRDFYFNNFLNSIKFTIANNNTIGNAVIKKPYHEELFNYIPLPKDIDFIKGYFQSYKYFQHNYQIIYNMLNLNSFMNNPKYTLDFPYISIHIRLGDFIHLPHFNLILDVKYYLNAIQLLKDKLGNDIYQFKFLVFGEKINDDIITSYINQLDPNLHFIKIYDLNPISPYQDYEEMIIMSKSSHIIIGNSTFSWWSAYLSSCDIIIHPHKSKWFAPQVKDKNLIDLFPSNWIEIDY